MRQKDLRGNRVCKAVEVGVSWAQVEVVWTVVSQGWKVHYAEDSLVCPGEVGYQPTYASCFPSPNSCGDQPFVSMGGTTESRNLALPCRPR